MYNHAEYFSTLAMYYISSLSWNVYCCAYIQYLHTISSCRISTASGTSHINLEDKLEENPVYNIPFQDEGGAIQITKNVSYAPTLSIPLHNSTTLVESSKLTSRYEESH